jgi:hypothetical protein
MSAGSGVVSGTESDGKMPDDARASETIRGK